MGKSTELKNTTELVKDILERCPEARNSDNILYIRVCEKLNSVALDMPFRFVLPNLKDFNLPSVETVGRCRRKIVEQYPELAGSNNVSGQRKLNEEAFKNYARGMV